MIKHNNQISFCIIGTPLAKQRSRKGGAGHWYNPQSDEMEILSRKIKEQLPEKFIIIPKGVPICCTIMCFIDLPKTMSKGMQKKCATDDNPCLNKKDVDNLFKLMADVMSGVVYDDDHQIYLGTCGKFYSANPRTEITIEY